MHNAIRQGLVEILKTNQDLLKIPVRQRAKFEGWLKFELANWLENNGYDNIEVESEKHFSRSKVDISFFHNANPYSIELKTPNTNWKISGVAEKNRPITENIQSIITDAKKLNSKSGIVGFVPFPVPINDDRWEFYLDRIQHQTELDICKEKNCEVVTISVNERSKCSLVVCCFMSKKYNNWF